MADLILIHMDKYVKFLIPVQSLLQSYDIYSVYPMFTLSSESTKSDRDTAEILEQKFIGINSSEVPNSEAVHMGK